MKNKTIAHVVFLMVCIIHTVQAQNLTIINQDYEKAKAECRLQHKLLLVDFYTSWCGPCKDLDRRIFRDTAIANEIGKKFIVLKYDAEKDSAHRLTLKHHVGMYPTTIVLNEKQQLLNKLYGFGGSDEDLVKNYLAFLDEGIIRNRNNNYVKGVSVSTALIYPRFYEEYVNRVNIKNVDVSVKAYWDTANNYLGEAPFAILCYFGGGNEKVNRFFLDNIKKYRELYDKTDVLFIVTMITIQKFSDAIRQKNRAMFDTAVHIARLHLEKETVGAFLQQKEEAMLRSEGRWPEAFAMLAGRMNEHDPDVYAVSSFCRDAIEQCDDMKVLEQCVLWMKKVTTKQEELYTLDLYARLLHKTGNKEEARIQMEKAIKAGKESKENTQRSEAWLLKNG